MLQDHVENLAPDSDDPLRDIMQDIGDVPTVEDMIGKALSFPLYTIYIPPPTPAYTLKAIYLGNFKGSKVLLSLKIEATEPENSV